MEALMAINGYVNGIVWGPPMLALLVGTGIYLTVILGFPQVRYFGFMFKEVLGKIGKKAPWRTGSPLLDVDHGHLRDDHQDDRGLAGGQVP